MLLSYQPRELAIVFVLTQYPRGMQLAQALHSICKRHRDILSNQRPACLRSPKPLALLLLVSFDAFKHLGST